MTDSHLKLREDRIEKEFKEYKPALNTVEAVAEANRCINCFDAPCIHACPTSINIPQFISRIANENPKAAAHTIFESNIFGKSCAQSCPTEVLCEGACVYHNLNKKPIQIGKLQQFATSYAYKHGIEFYKPGKSNGKRVALVGAGPASLACAHELRKHGVETVVYEKAQIAGGLNTTGIAPYKMKAQESLDEIASILKMGIEIKYGQELGRNLDLNTLCEEYDAVFLGLGLGPDSRLDIGGIDHPELYGKVVFGAVDFISKLKIFAKSEIAHLIKKNSALVVGGGNTALDACRELKQLGVENVYVSYRRDEAGMSGYAHEYAHSKEEGVQYLFHTLPTSIKPSKHGAEVTLTKTIVDSKGAVTTTNESRTMEFGIVLVATGQAKLEKLIASTKGLTFQKGKLVADAITGVTGNPHIYAGGDLVNGGMEVVNAVAEGKRAALGIMAKFGASIVPKINPNQFVTHMMSTQGGHTHG